MNYFLNLIHFKRMIIYWFTDGGNKKKYRQTRETGNIGYTRRRKTKQKHNTICVGHHSLCANKHKQRK